MPVAICTTGPPVPRSRLASLSVAKSPTITPQRSLPRRSFSVACSKVVLPEPGEDTTFNASISSARKRAAILLRKAIVGSKQRLVHDHGLVGMRSGMLVPVREPVAMIVVVVVRVIVAVPMGMFVRVLMAWAVGLRISMCVSVFVARGRGRQYAQPQCRTYQEISIEVKSISLPLRRSPLRWWHLGHSKFSAST